MSKHIAFVTDSLEHLQAQSTTCALMRALQEQGATLFWMEAADLHIQHNMPVGYMSSLRIDAEHAMTIEHSFLAPLERLDFIWWRKSPPYDVDMQLALDALQMLSGKTRVLNPPRTLRAINEATFALQFANFVPPTLITKSAKAIRAFLSEVGGKIVLRPMDASRTSFFLRIGDPNLNALTQQLTHNQTSYVLAQKLVTEPGLDGDKRIFLLNGEVLGIALQTPPVGEMRGAFERGAESARARLGAKDRQLVQVVGPVLREQGIFLASLDVSDGLLCDLNFSCPEGLTQLQSVSDHDIFGKILAAL